MSYESACRYAWNSTKKAHQPEYDQLIESYRDMLTARTEAVLATKMADDGPFAAFENAVLNAPPEPSASSDQGYEQVIDGFVPETEANAAEYEAVGEEVAKEPKTPKPPPNKKPAPKNPAVKKVAKKSAPKPRVIKKGGKK